MDEETKSKLKELEAHWIGKEIARNQYVIGISNLGKTKEGNWLYDLRTEFNIQKSS